MSGNPKPLRPAAGGRSNASRAKTSSRNPKIIIALISLTILLVVLIVWLLHQQTPPRPDNPPAAIVDMPATTLPPGADFVSENRIIFGGIPRPQHAGMNITILRNMAYMVGYSEQRKDPLWSAYRVIRLTKSVNESRPKGNFLTDTRTASKVTHHDYTGSGYDRGHMTPNFAIATRFGPEAQLQTFLLSNICPQAPALNQKVWEHLEKDEIEYSNTYGEIWVIDGPVFADLTGGTTSKLRSGISIPAAFYKIIIEANHGHPRLFSVIMPQTVKGNESPRQYLTSVDEIEKETQLEFLWTLDADTQRELKQKVWPMW